MAYTVCFEPGARRQFLDLPAEARAKLQPAIDALADNPRPPPPLGCKLRGEPGCYRLKLPPYRVLYHLDTKARVASILWVGLRRDAYRRR